MSFPKSPLISWFCILVASACAHAAEPDRARIDALMHKSGLWAQVGAMQAQVKQGAAEARAQDKALGPRAMSESDFERLAAITETAFAPERVRHATASYLAHELSAEEVDELLAWFTSAIGERVTRAEEDAAAADRLKAEDEGKALVAALTDARAQLLKRLIVAVRADEMAADLMANMANAMLYGIAAMTPGLEPEEAIRRLKKQADAERPERVEFFRGYMLAQAAYTYRGIGDADLERYVAFNETPVGRKYNEASGRAIDHAVVQAALEIGRKVAAEMDRKARRS
jgi:arsenate reductase-like glutaredoxin family protein